jgi:LuxR family transcriptional regulator, maltose regulon positive regulatory protein
MDTALLVTKLHIPQVSPKLVARPRLLARLADGLTRPLTLISAPAGFGKTTLLSEWRRSIAGQRWLLAWLSLDEGDSDPARFLAYLVAALQQIDPAIGHATQAMLHSPQPPPIEVLLTALINDIANVAAPFALVLDDYHVIDSPAVHQQLTFLLDHQPPQLHVIILTREDPPLPLSRLRARGQVAEIRQADLQFTLEETTAFLRQTARLEIDRNDAAALQQRTEGWIAGLQLLALSQRGHADARQWIQSFTGSDRYVLDYLIDEVFQRQRPDVQDFLLKTSILDRLSASLCDAVADRDNSRTLLSLLEHSNLFIVPLDPVREWYRYHRLFVDLLQHRLRIERPQAEPQLHQRASRWYADHGFPADAIHHALAAADWERAVDLISVAYDDLLRRGETMTLVNWFGALPDDFVRARSNLCLEYSWPLILAARLDEAESYLQCAEQLAQHETALLGQILTAQAYVARTHGDGRRAVELSQRALSLLPPDDDTSRGMVAMTLGMAYWYAGHLDGAHSLLSEARDASQRSGNPYAAATAQIFLCSIVKVRGQLHQAATAYQKLIEQSGPSPVAAFAQANLARLLYEWNDLEAAARLAQRSVELSEHGGNAEIVVTSYRTLAVIKQAQGDAAAAQAALKECVRLAEQPGLSPSARWHALADRASITLLSGDWAACAAVIDHYPPLDQVETLPDYLLLSATYARWLLTQGQHATCLAVLTARYEKANRAGALYAHVETRALQVLAAATHEESLSLLNEALTLAEPEGYIRTFVDLGEPMRLLFLRMKAEGGRMKSYIDTLLAAFPTQEEHHPSSLILQPLVEPLTERELEILRLLPTELSTRELVEHLVVSINTIKTQLKSIYAKLDVHSREEAVEKGRALSLL